MRSLFNRARGDRGAVAAEFVIVLPLLVLLTFGTFNMARAWNVHNVMDHAAREAARYGATSDPWDPDQVQQVGEQVLAASWVGPSVAAIQPPERVGPGETGCVDETDVYDAVADEPTRVHICVVAEDYPINLGFFTWEVTMRASSVSRYEGTTS